LIKFYFEGFADSLAYVFDGSKIVFSVFELAFQKPFFKKINMQIIHFSRFGKLRFLAKFV